MKQSIVHVALVVRDSDEAIEFYTKKLDFTLVEDTYQPEQDKRWVVVAPRGAEGTSLLLARASSPEQEPFVGNQTGGRVFLLLNTDDFWRDYSNLVSRGITFVREPKREAYGTVAVFQDLYGNLWDLLELRQRNVQEEQDAFNSLCAYTLARGDAAFIHQHVVDAFAAQHADESTKPIKVTFALVGLYLMVERQVSGRQVQRFHMQLARRKQTWPAFTLPANRGSMTAIEVMRADEGAPRDAAIHAWCESVWAAYSENREKVAGLLRERGIIQ